jgi:hypothetical protein
MIHLVGIRRRKSNLTQSKAAEPKGARWLSCQEVSGPYPIWIAIRPLAASTAALNANSGFLSIANSMACAAITVAGKAPTIKDTVSRRACIGPSTGRIGICLGLA